MIKILLVEDDVFIAENMKLSLEDLGYDVVESCSSFGEANKAIIEKDFDLAIFDINLGAKHENGGLLLAQRLSEDKNIPFIFVTAYADVNTIKEAAKLNPSAYLIKPANENAIFASIQLAIKNFQLRTPVQEVPNNEERSHFFFTKVGAKTHKVEWQSVCFLHAIKNYVEIKTTSSSIPYLLRTSLTTCLETMMPSSCTGKFIKINRSTVIDGAIVMSYSKKNVTTSMGEFKPNAKGYRLLNEYQV